ncbi:MAG TPA: hypothetical protein VL728_19425 [Cyclobacteriaceae bacterium]|jgi:hypothetical protein|nr:hypothetical protein [Cyclobacteriaceae bacterium]
MAVGGDILEITCNHPTLGSKTFSAKSGEGNTYDTGGFRTDDDANGITGNGKPIWKMNRKMGMFSATVENDMNLGKEAEFISALASDPNPADWTFSVVNGAVYKGTGKPVGDSQPNINDATVVLKVAAPQFKQIS